MDAEYFFMWSDKSPYTLVPIFIDSDVEIVDKVRKLGWYVSRSPFDSIMETISFAAKEFEASHPGWSVYRKCCYPKDTGWLEMVAPGCPLNLEG